jgi:hypothetical protein
MAEQLKGCLIVHAASIFTKPLKVNGLGSDSALWIGKPADWIFDKNLISLWIKKAPPWSGQGKATFYIINFNQTIKIPF